MIDSGIVRFDVQNELGPHVDLTPKQEEAKEGDVEQGESSYETLNNVSKSVNPITTKAPAKAGCEINEEPRASPPREKCPVDVPENVYLKASKHESLLQRDMNIPKEGQAPHTVEMFPGPLEIINSPHASVIEQIANEAASFKH